jgi:hypothetical protein
MFCGLIVFSAFEDDGTTFAQVRALVRASDPLWEASMRLVGYEIEDRAWEHTLRALSEILGVEGRIETAAACLDQGLLFHKAGNVKHNSALWSALYRVWEGILGGRRAGSR